MVFDILRLKEVIYRLCLCSLSFLPRSSFADVLVSETFLCLLSQISRMNFIIQLRLTLIQQDIYVILGVTLTHD